MNVQILGTGTYLPQRICTSSELEKELGLPSGFVEKRNGVRTRHIADQSKGETTSQMCAWAAEKALFEANLSKEKLDLIIFASAAPEQALPDTAPLVQAKLGLGESGIPCFSVHSTCLSFLTAFDIASTFISAGRYKNVLIVCCELSFTSIDPADPKTYTLFGDAAAAAVLGPTQEGYESEILRTHFSTFGSAAKLTEVRGCGTMLHPNNPKTTFADNTFRMKGKEILRYSLKKAPVVFERIWPGLSKGVDDFDIIVPHQPSKVGMMAMSRFLPPEKTIETLTEYGNCVSVSLPLTLDKAIKSGRLTRGGRCLMFGTGAGLTIAGTAFVY